MEVTALDEAGKKVDWFFIYKVPQLAAGATTDKTTGYEYVYYDASIDQPPTVSNRNILKSPYITDVENLFRLQRIFMRVRRRQRLVAL